MSVENKVEKSAEAEEKKSAAKSKAAAAKTKKPKDKIEKVVVEDDPSDLFATVKDQLDQWNAILDKK